MSNPYLYLGHGMTQVWYMKPEYFRNGIMGYAFCVQHGVLPDPHDLSATHVYLGTAPDSDPDTVYRNLQAENWSPNGEAAPYLQKLGLKHTSMSVGDIIVTGGQKLFVDNSGFETLKEGVMSNVDELVEGLLSEDVGDTIFQQLKAFGWSGLPLWGANGFVKGDNFLMFRVKGSKVMTGGKLKIILDPSDTYTVELWKLDRNADMGATKLDSSDDVYVDMLAEVITHMIGA